VYGGESANLNSAIGTLLVLVPWLTCRATTPDTHGTMTFLTVESPAALADLTPHWDDIPRGRRSPTDHLIWTQSCAETVAGGQALGVACVISDDGLSAVAPLARPRRFSGQTHIGVQELGEPADLIFRDHDSLVALTRGLARRKLPIVLPRIEADSPAIDALLTAYSGRRIVVRRENRRCPYVALGGCGNGAESVLSKRMRSDLRRARRQAEKLGEVFAEVLSPRSAAEFVELFDEAQRVEASSWKGRTKTALAADAERRAFFSAYGQRAVARGILRMAFLRIDGQAVATQIAVESDGRLWLLKIGYDHAFSRCSPGQLLMLESLEYACDSGLESLEFLGADAPWTRRWTKTERETISLAIYPATPRGLVALAGDFGPRVARALAQRGRGAAGSLAATARGHALRRSRPCT